MTTTICHSKSVSGKAKNVVEQIRKTLFNFDLEIARVETEIEYRKEIMSLTSQSTKKTDIKAFTLAKVEKENYEVFLSRLHAQKKALVERVSMIAKKYEGSYSEIFTLHFFEKHTHIEIAQMVGYSPSVVNHVIRRMENDLIQFNLK